MVHGEQLCQAKGCQTQQLQKYGGNVTCSPTSSPNEHVLESKPLTNLLRNSGLV